MLLLLLFAGDLQTIAKFYANSNSSSSRASSRGGGGAGRDHISGLWQSEVIFSFLSSALFSLRQGSVVFVAVGVACVCCMCNAVAGEVIDTHTHAQTCSDMQTRLLTKLGLANLHAADVFPPVEGRQGVGVRVCLLGEFKKQTEDRR